MTIAELDGFDFSAREQPPSDLASRDLLEGWLEYQRHEFLRKMRDLDADQLATWSIPPVELSVLGLVRHMTQMEHVYLVWGLGGGDRVLLYGEDDYAGGSAASVDEDLASYFSEVEKSRSVVANMADMKAKGLGHGRTLEATLVKMIDEYALHAGQAHMLRFAALGEVTR